MTCQSINIKTRKKGTMSSARKTRTMHQQKRQQTRHQARQAKFVQVVVEAPLYIPAGGAYLTSGQSAEDLALVSCDRCRTDNIPAAFHANSIDICLICAHTLLDEYYADVDHTKHGAPIKKGQNQSCSTYTTLFCPATAAYASSSTTHATHIVSCDRCGCGGLSTCFHCETVDICLTCADTMLRLKYLL